MKLTVRPYGVAARLIEFDVPLQQRRAVRSWIVSAVTDEDTEGAGTIVDVVPAARTVLVRYADEQACRASATVLGKWAETDVGTVLRWAANIDEPPDADVLQIPVRYDGADLAEVASLLGVETDEVVRRHQAARWIVEFTGFTAGFGYLSQVGERRELTVPRRDTPRTTIPAGSVALADEFSGVYPKASPGGWQLIGTTDVAVFDQHREPAALLTPGRQVRFVSRETARQRPPAKASGVGQSIDEGRAPREPDGPGASHTPGDTDTRGTTVRPDERVLTVERVGPQALIEDGGRLGSLGTGLSTSGACDRPAYRLANRIVGNTDGAAAIEVLLGGLVLRAERECVVAVTGAAVPLWRRRAVETGVSAGGRSGAVETDTPILLEQGDRLEVGTPRFGLRNYVAIAGGLEVPRVAGSSSSDPTAGVGPAPLRAGEELAGGQAWSGPSALAEHRAVRRPRDVGPLVLRATWGPRAEWFTDAARRRFATGSYRVGSDGNRVGIRFDGDPLDRAVTAELPSEAVVRGAVQVPADGRPLMFFADHPTTGGYPVVAVVDEPDTDLLAQARPGQEVRFAVRDA